MPHNSSRVFHTQFQNVNFRQACGALRRRRSQALGFWSGWGGLIVMALAIGAAAGALCAAIGGQLGNVLSLALAIGGLWWLLSRRIRRARAEMKNAPTRSGVTDIRLTPEGYVVQHPGHEGIVRWSHIVGVIATSQALLILHSDHEYYPIEAGAFKDAEDMEAVAAQIREWIASATPPPSTA